MAETEGFEPSVRVIPVRRFSKPLVSATHPRLRKGPEVEAYSDGLWHDQRENRLDAKSTPVVDPFIAASGVWT